MASEWLAIRYNNYYDLSQTLAEESSSDINCLSSKFFESLLEGYIEGRTIKSVMKDYALSGMPESNELFRRFGFGIIFEDIPESESGKEPEIKKLDPVEPEKQMGKVSKDPLELSGIESERIAVVKNLISTILRRNGENADPKRISVRFSKTPLQGSN